MERLSTEEKAKKYDELLELAAASKYVAFVLKDKIVFKDKCLGVPEKVEQCKVPIQRVETSLPIIEFDEGNPRIVCNRNICWRIP